MKINNVKLDFDIADVDFASSVELELDKLKELRVPDGTSWSNILLIQCDAISEFFDNVFGKGTSEKLFGEKKNLKFSISTLKEFEKLYLEELNLFSEGIKATSKKIALVN